MSDSPVPERDRPDACPGAVQVHPAADGGLARVRVPGGVLSAGQVRVVAGAAVELGNSTIELTSRANLQLRGVDDPGELGRRLGEAGLLPSATHERVRNIVASPYAGLDGPTPFPVSRVVEELDHGLRSVPALAELPGRFLFTVDDGRGDVSALGGDVGLLPVAAHRVAVLLAGADSGVRVPPERAAAAAVTAAEGFLAERARNGSGAWRMAELTTTRLVSDTVRARHGTRAADVVEVTPASWAESGQQGKPRPGVLGRDEDTVAVEVGAPLGRLSPAQTHSIIRAAEAASGFVRLTPWRTVILTGVRERDHRSWLSELHSCGLLVEPSAPLSGVTACAGYPGCAKSLADVHRDAACGTSRGESAAPGALPVHWVGCSRRCGLPRGPVVEVLAEPSGYRVSAGTPQERVTWASEADPEVAAEAANRARHAGVVRTAGTPGAGFGNGRTSKDRDTTNEDDR
ncbi:precorrin-3B synthase [Actinopolyspora mortivallis]|uniref:precorrin-3B synthase n=1 Tax=Actinopolyspora mortivallis TaxID=33906 RepID=UPI0003798C39|nr:precorrin-3B synthase [Actinopolyspora mortivallis]